MRITLRAGDICEFDGDAVVNAANNLGLGGGGVDGAIHRAAGPRLLEACKMLPLLDIKGKGRNQGPVDRIRIRDGGCVPTPAFDMPAKWIFHTVGPVWPSDPDADVYVPNNPPSCLAGVQMKLGVAKTTGDALARKALRQCFKTPLMTALGMGLETLAFPAISTGVYGCPTETCAEVAFKWARDYGDWPIDVFFYLYPPSHLKVWKAVADRMNFPVEVGEV